MQGNGSRGSKGASTAADEPVSGGRRHRLSIIAAVGALVVGGGAFASVASGSPNRSPGTVAYGAAAGAKITVSASGVVSATPNELTLEMGASTTEPSAVAALDDNDAEVARLEAVFRANGVLPKNLQTSDLSLSPNYNNNGDVTGYQVSDTLTVTLTDLASAGSVIDAAAHAVGNDVEINSITFSVANDSGLLTTARERAMHEAEQKAATLAAAGGTSLGPIVSISESEQQPSPVIEPVFNAAARSSGASVPVEAGSQQVSVNVTVVYELGGDRS